MRALPIDSILGEVIEILRHHRGVVIEAPPGAGKSTRVPPALLDAGVAGEKAIWMLEPRRVAARATARRIAAERGVEVGGEVGYQVRFDCRMTAETRLAVVTEGILTRKMQGDPFLEELGVVIVDEFHERSIHTDLGIAFLREVMGVREDLKVVVMSATMRAEPIARYLDVPSIKSEGRTYPVKIEYLERPPEESMEVEAARAVRSYVGSKRDDGGDVLVFMPGRGEIHRFLDTLEEWGESEGVELLPLYSGLRAEEQDRALATGGPRKIIAATNIAETSLTLEGVTLVVDSGRVRQMRRSEATGLDNLELGPISLASADQRAGRAGRVREGRAIRLWMKANEHRMEEYDEPEIQRVDLSAPLLEILAWSGRDPREFSFFERPSEGAIFEGLDLLGRLGAMEDGEFRLSSIGKALLELPVHPRLGRILLEGKKRGVEETVAAMAAIVSERDFVLSVDSDAPTGTSDLLVRAEVLNRRELGESSGKGLRIHRGRAHRVREVREQLIDIVGGRKTGRTRACEEEEARKSLLLGYPDRIALRREEGANRFVMSGGVPLTLARESVVREAKWIVAAVIMGETRAWENLGGVDRRALIRQASAVEEAWVREAFPGRFECRIEIGFDEERERVMAREVEWFSGLELASRVVSLTEHAEPVEVLAEIKERALLDLDRSFGLSQGDRNLLLRWDLARRLFPELGFARLLLGENEGDGEQEIWNHLLWGKRSFQELRKIGLSGALKAYLSRDQRQILEEELPERLEVPSGSKIQLNYRFGGAPILAVRIQEVFGLKETPRIARGRQSLLMHLLAPNYRPAQVTDDLAGFWERTYPEVRRELRARYSRHPWPEDPLSATAVNK